MVGGTHLSNGPAYYAHIYPAVWEEFKKTGNMLAVDPKFGEVAINKCQFDLLRPVTSSKDATATPLGYYFPFRLLPDPNRVYLINGKKIN